jgi:hypothetical protein
MRTKLAGRAATLVLLAGCGMLAARSSEADDASVPGVYANQEARFSFRVPPEWRQKKSLNPFRRPRYLVRYDSPEGDAMAVASTGPLGSQTCIDAGLALLESASGTAVKSEETFYLKIASGELPAGYGKISSGERRGAAKIFCDGDRVVVLEASADKPAYAQRKNELASILESLAYRGKDGETPVVAAKAPPPPSYFVHVVKWRGQTLGKIAEWYTGQFDNWKELSSINDVTAADAKLKLGREVKIPKGLVVQESPLPEPKQKVSSRKGKRPAKRAAAKAGAEEEEEEGVEAPALPPVMGPR